jgi:hypothetical protein
MFQIILQCNLQIRFDRFFVNFLLTKILSSTSPRAKALMLQMNRATDAARPARIVRFTGPWVVGDQRGVGLP